MKNQVSSNAWIITGASLVSTTLIGTQTTPQGLFIREDGLKIYNTDRASSPVRVVESDLTSAWQSSTVSILRTSAVNTQDSSPYGVYFKEDGLKMYILGTANTSIFQYSLSTAWNISTKTYVQSFSLTAHVSTATGFTFNNDGTKVYVGDNDAPDDITQYNLSTAWDISTCTYVGAKVVSAQDGAIRGMYMSPDGTMFFFAGLVTHKIFKYTLSTPYLISSATYDSEFLVTVTVGQLISVYFKPDGTKMYAYLSSSGGLKEYNL